MAIKGLFVVNMTQNSDKFRVQVEEFINKSRLIPNLSLVEVKNQDVFHYLAQNKVDFCLFWDKDIYLARTLQSRGIKVFNDPEAISVCDDKALTASMLTKHKVAQPAYYVLPLHYYGNVFTYYEKYKDNILALGFPVVIKERNGSFGEQVYLANNEEELQRIISEHGEKPLMAQAYVSHSYGTDYRLNVVGDHVISSVKRTNADDFRSNINQGGKAEYFVPNREMINLAILATKAVNAHFAGVDIMIDEFGEPQVIEVNSNMRTVAVNKVSPQDLTLAILNYIIENL